MASSSKYDRLQDKINQTSQELNEQASANAKPVGIPTYESTANALTTGTTGVGVSVSSGNAEAVTKTAATPVDAYANQSDEVKSIIRHMEYYTLQAASNKKVVRSDLISLQTAFFRNMELMVNLPSNKDFAICFRRLLTLVNENTTGAFSIDSMHRCISSINKGNAEIDRYTKFIDMVLVFSDPASRTLYIRRYNLEAGAEFAKPQYRERVIEFIRAICGL